MTGARNERKGKATRTSAEELHEQAEVLLGGLSAVSAVPEDTAAIVHELRVHQIELETQNEELRSAQLELDTQREKYFELFDMAPVGYVTLGDDDIVGDANLTAAEALGVERQLLVGQPLSAFVLAPDRDVYYLQRGKLLETGEPQTCELRLRRFVGDTGAESTSRPFWAHLEWRRRLAAHGETIVTWVTFNDVDVRKHAESALTMANALLLERSHRGERLNEALNEVNAKLNASFGVEPGLDKVLEIACSALGCDIALLGCAGLDDSRVEHSFGLEVPDDGLDFDQLLLGALSSDTPLVCESAGSPYEAWLGTRLGLTEAVVALVPARRGTGRVLLLGRTTGERGFDDQSIDFVRRLALSLALSLANTAQFKAEHDIAQTLQMALLTLPASVPGIEFASSYSSATEAMEVGGDFYDLFELDDRGVGITIGDISGKGLDAAVLTSLVKNTIRAFASEKGKTPAQVLMQANDVVFRATPTEVFATVFFAILDHRTGRLVCANAGHPAAALMKDDGTFVRLTTTGTMLGAFPGVTYRESEAFLGLDELLFLYTDGLTEARRDGELYGEERLFAFLSVLKSRTASDVISASLGDVTSFAGDRLRDDLAILALRRLEPKEGS